MSKYYLVLLIPFALSASNNIDKLQMACDIGNEKACTELKQYLASKNENVPEKSQSSKSTAPKIKENINISDDYNKISCPAVVLDRYPALNKHYNKVIWRDVVIGYKSHWEELGVTSPLDAIRWGDMRIRPSDYDYAPLKKLGITKPIEAKKWLCANVWDGNGGGFAHIIEGWMRDGITTPEELKQYLASKNENVPEKSQSSKSTAPKIKENINISDDYNKISCPAVVLDRYPALNKHYNKVIWRDVVIGYKSHWEELGVTSPLDAIRWGDMRIRPSDYDYAPLKKLGITKPIEAKKWLCANVWDGNGGGFAHIIEGWMRDGITTPEELKQYLASKNEQGEINHEPTKVEQINNNVVSSRDKTDSCVSRPQNLFIWNGYGISNNEAKAWVCAGIGARDAKDWRQMGIQTADRAQIWLQLGVGLSTLRNLRSIGIKSPKQVKTWIDAGITAPQISYWIENGVKSPKEAKGWIAADIPLGDVKKWKKLGISAEEAGQ